MMATLTEGHDLLDHSSNQQVRGVKVVEVLGWRLERKGRFKSEASVDGGHCAGPEARIQNAY